MKYISTIHDTNNAETLKLSMNIFSAVCHGVSLESGWWFHKAANIDLKEAINDPCSELHALIGQLVVCQKLLLSHSELSEGMEGHRKGLMDDKLPHRTMFEVEMADAMIRIADLCGAMNLDIGGSIVEKLQFNTKRPDHKAESREKEGGKAY